MMKFLAYSEYLAQLDGSAPPVSALEDAEEKPELASVPYPLGAAGPPVALSSRYEDLGLCLSAAVIAKYFEPDAPSDRALFLWENKASQSEVSKVEFFLPSRLVLGRHPEGCHWPLSSEFRWRCRAHCGHQGLWSMLPDLICP